MSELRVKKIVVAMSLLWGVQGHASADVLFPESLLKAIVPQNQQADLSFFDRGFSLIPGQYDVDVYVNKQLVKRMSLTFKDSDGRLMPELPASFFKAVGIKPSYLEGDDVIFAIEDQFKGAVVDFDGPNLRLNLSIPQAYFKTESVIPNDVVSSELWDNGITAGMLNYSLNASHFDDRNYSKTYNQNLSLLLEGQINIGAWRLFSAANYEFSRYRFLGYGSQNEGWDIWNTYLQTDLAPIHSTIKMGELYVTSDLFDTFPMRGVNLATNEQMLPYADRSYAPTITGYADTFAQVFVRQNGHIVYQTNVSPGPWVLENLPPLGDSADLEVVVREADGRERVETVPCVAVPMMLKEGQFRYNVSAGRYDRNDFLKNDMDPSFGQATFSYGMPWNTTLLGGLFLSKDYQAYALGTAFSLGTLGALSIDAIHSRLSDDAFVHQDELSGFAYRVRYKKSLDSTGTNINLASYRYSSKDYYSFANLMSKPGDLPFDTNHMKNRWQISISQPLGKWGHINASGNYITYYDSDFDNKTWSVSYSKNYRDISFHLTYSRSYEKMLGAWKPNEELMLNVNIPLSKLLGENVKPAKYLTTEFQTSIDRHDSNSDSTHRVGLIYNNPSSDWYWQLYQNFGSQEAKESSAMIGYDGDRLSSSLAYVRSQDGQSYQLSASGGAVLHDKGITFSSRAFDSVALIEVPNVENVKINQSADVRTDGRGYAVVTSLRNYAPNELSIDPTTLPEGALMLQGTNQVVYPTGRAITKLVYPIRLGHQALVYLYQSNDQPLPFGTNVAFVEDNEGTTRVTSLVGDVGRTYFSGIPKQGCLRATSGLIGKDLYYHFTLPDRPEGDRDESFVWMPTIHLKPVSETMCR